VKTTKRLSMGRGARGKKVAAEVKPASPAVTGRVPRITKLMALAIKFDQMIRDGVVKDQADLARLGLVTRARVTQILNLLNLAGPIQERLLALSPICEGKDSVTERQLRPIMELGDWTAQQKTLDGCSTYVADEHRSR
jgi:hypothetical protein